MKTMTEVVKKLNILKDEVVEQDALHHYIIYQSAAICVYRSFVKVISRVAK